jgi:diguanylate cyclase (GGDEF)-like protein/PAS domain S-box-containing protein
MSAPRDPDGAPDLDGFWRDLQACHRDLPSLLGVIADQVVSVLGEGCVLTTVTADGAWLEPRVVVHADPQVAEAMRSALANRNARVGEGIAGRVAEDRRSIVVNGLPSEVASATSAHYRPFAARHPMRGLAIVPMVAGGELVGTLGSVRTTSSRPYTPTDLRALEALAERAALAISDAITTRRAVGPADFEAIFVHSLDGVLLTTPDGRILAANPAACTILGRTEREIVEGGRALLVVSEDPRLARSIEERAATGRARAELQMRRGDGTTFVADVSSTIFTTPDDEARACVIFRDISDVVAAREHASARVSELEHVAYRDALTGLLNRRGFAIAAEHALAAADRDSLSSELLFLDIDGLKAINDNRGHLAGDAAIVATADAVRGAIRGADVACRLGGDEVILLLIDTDPADVDAIVERIQTALEIDERLPGALSVSVGSVRRGAGSTVTLDELIDAADRDMYKHKVLGRRR